MIKSIRVGLFHVFDGLAALFHVGAARNRLHDLGARFDAFKVHSDALTVDSDALKVRCDALTVDSNALKVRCDALKVDSDALTVRCEALEDLVREQVDALARQSDERRQDREDFARVLADLQRRHQDERLQSEADLRRHHAEEMARLGRECQQWLEQSLNDVYRIVADDRRHLALDRYYLQLGLQQHLDQVHGASIERCRSTSDAFVKPVPLRFADRGAPALPAHPDNHHLVILPYSLLSVAPLQPAQSQQRAIDVLFALQRLGETNLCLVLASPGTSADDEDYIAFLRRYAEHLGLHEAVHISPGRSESELVHDYHAADLYLRLTDAPCDDEGGCRRALERALHHDRLVLAHDAGCDDVLAALLPPASRFPELAPDRIAGRIRLLMRDSGRRRDRLVAQRAWLASARGTRPDRPSSALNVRIEGPYDSTYSLALVNCATARALIERGDRVTLHSTDGYGDNRPRRAFLRDHPDIDTIRRVHLDRVDVTLRNLYPPRTNAMAGVDRVMGPYGWEESGFPSDWIQGFNRRLTGVLCMSDYVRNVLVANGLKVPAVTTGIVADEILRHAPLDPGFALPQGYRLLHVSSGFPRKGVDVLLDAFQHLPAEMSLVIKTFPNPHNDIQRQLLDLGFQGSSLGGDDGAGQASVTRWVSGGRHVLLIDADLEPGHIAWLYRHADLLVAPSRGEGFGLPMAEAMLLGLPVVTTDCGGQRDFCTPETAWLIESRLAPARTHFDLPGSQWAEPSASSLVQRILEVMRSNPAERRLRMDRAQDLVRRRYNPQAVAGRIHHALRLFAEAGPAS